MLIGIFGSQDDPQCRQMAAILESKGHSSLLVDADAIGSGIDHTLLDGDLYYQDVRLDEVRAYYLRHITSPMAPIFQTPEGETVLYQDWFNQYMHLREQQGLIISFLLSLEERGACMVNPPFAGSVNQYKPFQLATAHRHGIPLPRTLVTNNPERVAAFAEEVGDVVYKPSMGGALCCVLDHDKMDELELIRQSPVIFQERIVGEDVRVMVLNGKVVSSVVVDSATLDFREDPDYSSGAGTYRELELPEEVQSLCAEAALLLGLRFAGIDLKYCGEDRYYFIEANSSPIYLDVELKLGHRITEQLADFLIEQASRPSDGPPAGLGLRQHQAKMHRSSDL